jgi:glycosyltransferase involved in cell wall biosynthesis
VFSFIITNYKKHYLIKALQLLRFQIFKKFEVIVIDYNSIDGTSEVIKKYKNLNINYLLNNY